MDQKKIENLQIKLKTLDADGRTGCLYQWILTKHIRLPEFTVLLKWCQDNPALVPVVQSPDENTEE